MLKITNIVRSFIVLSWILCLILLAGCATYSYIEKRLQLEKTGPLKVIKGDTKPLSGFQQLQKEIKFNPAVEVLVEQNGLPDYINIPKGGLGENLLELIYVNQNKVFKFKKRIGESMRLVDTYFTPGHSLPKPKDVYKEVKPTEVMITASRANIREQPTVESRKIATLKKSTVVTKHEVKGNWVRVKLASGKVGWIYHTMVGPKVPLPKSIEPKSGEVKEIKDEKVTKKKEKERWVTVQSVGQSGSEIEIRSGPGVFHEVIEQVRPGTKLEYLGEEEDWVKVKSMKGEGYIYKEFIR